MVSFHRWRTLGGPWRSLKPLAREHRADGTAAEDLLWQRLRNRRLGGHRFRRQHAIGGYIVDFACPEAGLVVEVDGGVHLDQQEADRIRERVLAGHGFRVLRVRNEEVLERLDAVVARIADTIRAAETGTPTHV
jgi:very-short-patch-repair endonuclease